MARTRLLHPGFFRDEDLVSLPPFARILFEGLWTIADRAGRLEDRPRQIKLDVLPWDDVDVNDLLDQLDQKGLIRRYEVDGGRFIQVTQFAKYQSPHVREKASVIPAAPDKPVPSTVPARNEAQLRSPVSDPVRVSVSDPVRDPVSGSSEKEQRRAAPPSSPNVKVITKIAHEVIDLEGWDSENLSEGVKALCAQRRIPYNGKSVGQAIDSAREQRRRH